MKFWESIKRLGDSPYFYYWEWEARPRDLFTMDVRIENVIVLARHELTLWTDYRRLSLPSMMTFRAKVDGKTMAIARVDT